MKPTAVYHGSPHWARILKEGLRGAHIWLALAPQHAAVFGVVIEVDVTGWTQDWPIAEEDGLPSWQACCHDGYIPPERLCLYGEKRRVNILQLALKSLGSANQKGVVMNGWNWWGR